MRQIGTYSNRPVYRFTLEIVEGGRVIRETTDGYSPLAAIAEAIREHDPESVALACEHILLLNGHTDRGTVGALIELIESTAQLPAAIDRLEEMRRYPSYANGSSGHGLAVGDWNGVSRWREDIGRHETIDTTMPELGAVLEFCGLELDWDDMCKECSECYLPVETEPSYYGWQPSFYTFSDSDQPVCDACLVGMEAEVVEDIESNPRRALNGQDIDLSDHGFTRLDLDMETGFHPGQDSDPHAVAELLESREVSRYCFEIDSVGQFDSSWSIWVDSDEIDLARGIERSDADGYSPSRAMQAGLRAAASLPNPPGDGPVIVKVGDGTATAKRVSRQDFVEGRALD